MNLSHAAEPPSRTFHLVARTIWLASNASRPYAPASLEREGFIHCTDGADELAATANRHFADLDDELLVLVLERALIVAPVRYDDMLRVYPHIYGPLNRDAIVAVISLLRDSDGAFLPPADVPAAGEQPGAHTD